MAFIDAHCHLDFARFDGVLGEELARARELGVAGAVIPGVRRADWPRVRAVAQAHAGLWYCLGVHPWYVEEHRAQDLAVLERELAERPEHFVGIGECGLDRLRGDLATQLPWFEAQARLAMRHDLPLVVHSVRTHDEVHGLLRRLQWSGRTLIHGFSGSYQQASKLVDLGCCIGVGGAVTYPRAHKTRQAIARLPAECLVLETDAPDMSPQGVPAHHNSPVHLPRVFDALAGLRNEPREALAEVILTTTRRLFGLPGAGT